MAAAVVLTGQTFCAVSSKCSTWRGRAGLGHPGKVLTPWNALEGCCKQLGLVLTVLRRTAWPKPGTTLPLDSVFSVKIFTSSLLGSSPSCRGRKGRIQVRLVVDLA